MDANPHKTKSEIASDLGIAYTTLCTVNSKRNTILNELLKWVQNQQNAAISKAGDM